MADFELGEQTGTQTGVSYEVIAGIMIGSTLVLMTGIGVYVLRVVQQSRATLDTLMDNISILKRATVRDRDDNDGPGMYGSSANQPARAIPEAPQLLRRFPVATFDGQETLMTKEDVERAVTDPVVQKVAQTHGHRFNLGGGGEIDSDAIMSLFDVRKHGVIPTRLFLWGLWVDDVSTAFTNARLMERETLLTLFPTVTPDNRESTEMSTEEVARALLMPEVQEIVARYGHRFSPQGIGAIDASKVMALFDQNNKGLIPTWMFLWGLGLDDPPKADALAPEPTWTALSQQPVELRLLDAFPVVSAGGREIELVKEDIDVQLQNHDVREMLAHSKHVFHPDEDGQITGATVMETLDFDQRGKITQRLLLKGLGVGGVSGLERVVSTREAEATIQDTSTLTEFLKGLHARGAATRAAERVASPGKSKKPKTPKAKKKEKVTPSAGTSVLPLSVMAAAAKAAAAAAEKVEKAKNVGKTGILVDADANELSEGASLTDVFHALDDDESGHLDRKELAEGLRDPHIQSIIHASGVDVEVLLDELDDDGSGMIDINEFLDGITNIGRALGITPAKPKERRSSHISVMDRIKEQHTAHDVAPVNDLVEMHNSKWKGAAKRINNLQFKSPEKRAQTNEQNFQTLFPAYNKLKAQSEDGLVHLADFEQACIDMPGLMTLSERSGMTVEQLFHRLDKDGSGDISVIEFVRGVEKLANELGFSPDDLDPKVAGANTPGQSAWRGAKGKLSAIAALGRGDGRTPLGSPPLDVSANLSGAVARQRSSFDSAGSPESAGSPIIGKEGGKHKSPRGFGSSGSPPAVNRPTRSSHFDGMHLFQALDVERDGSLTWDELDKGVHRPEMQKIIEDNGISVEHLAEKLDPNRTGEITLMMFIKGIGRLNKEAAQKKTGPLASLEEGRNEKTPSPAPTDSSFASTSEEEEEEDIDLESFASDDVNNREPNTSAPVLKTSAPPPAPTPAPTPPAPPPVPAPAIPTHATPAPAAEFDLSSFASTSDEEEDDDATLEPAPQRAPPAFAEIFTPSSVAEDMYGLNKAKVALLMGSPQFDALPVKVAHEGKLHGSSIVILVCIINHFLTPLYLPALSFTHTTLSSGGRLDCGGPGVYQRRSADLQP